MKKIYTLLFVIIAFCLTACSKEDTKSETDTARNANSLIGKYVSGQNENSSKQSANNKDLSKNNSKDNANGNEEATTTEFDNNIHSSDTGNNDNNNSINTASDSSNENTSGKQTSDTNMPSSNTNIDETNTDFILDIKVSTKDYNPGQIVTSSGSSSDEEQTTAPITAGTVSGNVKWNFDGSTLTVYGSGSMPDFRQGSSPWYGLKGDIKTIIVSNGVTNIGNYTFYNCTAATNATIANSVTSVGSNAFLNCTSLKEVQMSNAITRLGNDAFRMCSSLTTINLPATLVQIGSYAFDQCFKLTVYGPANCKAQSQMQSWGISYVIQ